MNHQNIISEGKRVIAVNAVNDRFYFEHLLFIVYDHSFCHNSGSLWKFFNTADFIRLFKLKGKSEIKEF